MTRPLRFLLLLPLLSLPAASLEIRTYDPAVHSLFTGFPAAPVRNPNFIFDASKFTGIGWFSSGAHKYCALVSPRHFLWATHHDLNELTNGEFISYINDAGSPVQRSVSGHTIISSD